MDRLNFLDLLECLGGIGDDDSDGGSELLMTNEDDDDGKLSLARLKKPIPQL